MYAVHLALASLLASSVLAVNIPGLPACAGNCLNGYGGCSSFDVHCICANHKLIAGLACCVSTACSTADQEETLKFAKALCAGQGITNLPQSATCASTAAASKTSSTASTAAATGSASSSTASNASSASSSPTGSAASAQSSASSSSSSAPAAATTGAANREDIGKLGVGMVVAGLVAAL